MGRGEVKVLIIVSGFTEFGIGELMQMYWRKLKPGGGVMF